MEKLLSFAEKNQLQRLSTFMRSIIFRGYLLNLSRALCLNLWLVMVHHVWVTEQSLQ